MSILDQAAKNQKAAQYDEMMRKKEIVDAYNKGGADVSQQAAYNKAAYDQGLADEAVRRNEAYANEHLGYGLTRRDLANFMGAPVNSVRLDQFSDGELQALGQQKQIQQAKDQAAIQDMIAKNRAYNKDKAVQNSNMNKPMDMVEYAQVMYSPEANRIAEYENTIDPGLAALWQSSYKK